MKDDLIRFLSWKRNNNSSLFSFESSYMCLYLTWVCRKSRTKIWCEIAKRLWLSLYTRQHLIRHWLLIVPNRQTADSLKSRKKKEFRILFVQIAQFQVSLPSHALIGWKLQGYYKCYLLKINKNCMLLLQTDRSIEFSFNLAFFVFWNFH